MQTTEQADMAQRLLNDDEQVLEDILRAYGSMILVVLSRRYQNVLREADIEDVVSIGLFRLWKNRTRFDRRKASLKVWFFRITENAARDVLRHGWHKARQLEVTSDTALVSLADPSGNGRAVSPYDEHQGIPSNDDENPPTNLQLDLREIVADLPEKQRYIVMADAATPEGTASSQLLGAELGIPDSTVRVYRKRAMDRIKRELEKRGYDVPAT